MFKPEGQRDYTSKFKPSVDTFPPNPKVNFNQFSNPFHVLQVDECERVAPTDSADKVACQSTDLHRSSEVDELGNSTILLLPPEDNISIISHATTCTPQPHELTSQPVDELIPQPKKQSTQNLKLKHGPIRPTPTG